MFKQPRAVALGLILIAIALLWLGVGQGQTDRTTPPDARFQDYRQDELFIGNRPFAVYPTDPKLAYQDTSWKYIRPGRLLEEPVYDKEKETLTCTLDFSVPPDAITDLKERLVGRYIAHGRVDVQPSNIDVTALSMIGYRVVLPWDGREYPPEGHKNWSNPKSSAMLSGNEGDIKPTFIWRLRTLPKELKDVLAGNRTAVRIIYRPFYNVEELRRVDVTGTMIQGSYRKFFEQVTGKQPDHNPVLFVTRDVHDDLISKLSNRIHVVATASGFSLGDQLNLISDARAAVLSRLEKLPPVKLEDLKAESDNIWVWTKDIGVQEISPKLLREDTSDQYIEREVKSKVETSTKHFSDNARDSTLDTRQFHDKLRKLKLDGQLDVNVIAVVDSKAKLHLETEDKDLTDNQLKDIKHARDIINDESTFKSEVSDKFKSVFKGLRKTVESSAKSLDVHRISEVTLSGWSESSDTLILPMRVTVVPRDIEFYLRVADREQRQPTQQDRRMKELEAKLQELNQKLMAQEIILSRVPRHAHFEVRLSVGAKKYGRAFEWAVPKKDEHQVINLLDEIKGFSRGNERIDIDFDKGKPLTFGQEILDVWLEPVKIPEDDGIEAWHYFHVDRADEFHREDMPKNKVRIFAFHHNGSPDLATTVRIHVVYRP